VSVAQLLDRAEAADKADKAEKLARLRRHVSTAERLLAYPHPDTSGARRDELRRVMDDIADVARYLSEQYFSDREA